jgi:D-psicose/D-tagatose/L-ribulose 3-epimerase
MNIAISNIAWDYKEDDDISVILQKYTIKGIEIAPTKIWSDPVSIEKDDIISYKSYWEKKGIEIIAMQSLLFGHPELTIFEDSKKRKETISYLKKIIQLAAFLGVKAMVFGSPKNRIAGDKDQKEINEIASDFFSQIGDNAKEYDIHFCIEANPKVYGTDFLTTTDDLLTFVRKLHHSHINIHIDTGAMKLNNENPYQTIERAKPFYHFHISEPNLLPVPYEVEHHKIAKILKEINYKQWVSVEMRSQQDGSNVKQVEKTLEFVTNIYK